MANLVRHIAGRVSKRAANAKGFTLVEMLAALAVLALLTGMVAMGTQVATTAYGAEQFASQSDVLAGEIENALAAKYRYATSENPELLVSDDGRFVLKDADGEKELLNPGAYGNCKVSFTGETTSLKPVKQSDGSYVIEGAYEISKKKGTSSARAYSFYFKSYGDTPNGQAYGGISSSGGSSGESGDNTDTAIHEARAALDALIQTAKDIGQGNKYESAFNQLQAAIATAEGWRDNDSATEQELKDAKQALQDAIEAFNNSEAEQQEVTFSSMAITLDPDTAEYDIGDAGTASAVATYSDNSTKTEASWESSDSSIVSIDASTGAFTCHAGGSATLTATIDGHSASVTITVESGHQGGDTFTITIGGHTYSSDVEEYDGNGVITAGTVYSYNGSYYYANKDVNDPYNPNIESRSQWDYASGGVAKITETFVEASDFTAENGRKCPTTIAKGTLYYDSEHGKLYSCHQTQMWMTRPDYDTNGWDDVSGLISG